jgi:nucleoside-diphosphate-sugar epimerase
LKKKILIIGGGGYVGCELVRELLLLNYQVYVYDLFIYGIECLPKDENLYVIKGDIRDLNKVNNSLKEIDICIHLACISNDPSFELNPKLGKEINLDSFEPLIISCIKNKVKRFIFASSSSVYGVSEVKDVQENHALRPLTDYSKFKAECELILQKYKKHDLEWTIIRPATVCGYSHRQRFDLVVNLLTNLAFNKKKITVLGGSQLRPNIHIKDMVNAYLTVINSKSSLVNFETFNVGFENMAVLDIATIIKKQFNENIEIEIKNSDDNRSYHISSNKIRSRLSFVPQYSLVEAIQDIIQAFKEKKYVNSLDNEIYFNIKRMRSLNLN